MLPRLFALARAPVEVTEAEVAVGDEGAHAAGLGQRQRLAIVGLAGDIASAAGADDAERSYREALKLAVELGMRPLVAHCHLGLGKLYRRAGNREQAQAHLATATTMYREMGMTYWLEKAEAEMRESA